MDLSQSGRRSRKAAIDRHCRNCIYDPSAPGTWRQQIELCSVADCALYPFRPVGYGTIAESVLGYFHVADQSCLSDAEIRREPANLGASTDSAVCRVGLSSGGAQNV